MKPSTLMALLNGDLENAVISATPGGIELQEAQGQKDFVVNSTLPKRFLGCGKSQFEAMGIVFGDDADDLFVNVILPDGWCKRPTDHNMWSELIDDKGHKRAMIFYKAAFYDRSAHIFMCARYNVCTVFDDKHGEGCRRSASVEDCGNIIFQTEWSRPQPNDDDREDLFSWWDETDALVKTAKEWAEENYPDYKSPLAYWVE